MVIIKQLLVIFGLTAGALFAVLVHADEGEDVGWSYEITVGVGREPTYVGSDRYQTEAGGDFEIRYQTEQGTQYFLGLGEVGVYFETDNDWGIGAVLEYEEGRDNSKDPILSGFPEVRDTVEGQFTLIKEIGDWTVSGVFQPDILDRGKGLVYFVALGYETDLNSRLSVSTALDISFADAEHMNTEVGITKEASSASGLKVYNAGSGYKSTTFGVNLEYAITEQWTLVTEMEAEFYGSNISDSPLVRDEGNDVNYNAGLSLEYSF